MNLTSFISNLNKAWFLAPLLLHRTLLVEIKPLQESSHYIELSACGAKKLHTPPTVVDFVLEGEQHDLEEILLNRVNLKQLISLGSIKVKGSYRDYLKFEAILKLS